jgi:hypothetical protein
MDLQNKHQDLPAIKWSRFVFAQSGKKEWMKCHYPITGKATAQAGVTLPGQIVYVVKWL